MTFEEEARQLGLSPRQWSRYLKTNQRLSDIAEQIAEREAQELGLEVNTKEWHQFMGARGREFGHHCLDQESYVESLLQKSRAVVLAAA